MRIFVLEENPCRIIDFRRKLVEHTVDHAETILHSKNLITTNQYDLLLLNHDLVIEKTNNPISFIGRISFYTILGNIGCQIAKIIASSILNKTTPCIIYSYDSDGADIIMRVLPHAIHMPYLSLNIIPITKAISQIMSNTNSNKILNDMLKKLPKNKGV